MSDMSLQALQYEDVPKFSFSGIKCNAKCVKVYDGDTITVIMKLLGLPAMRYSIRLSNLDTAELKSDNEIEKLFAEHTQKVCSDMLLGKMIKLDLGKFDKYGRILAKVYCDTLGINVDVSTHLIQNHMGYIYGGGKKLKFEEWADSKVCDVLKKLTLERKT